LSADEPFDLLDHLANLELENESRLAQVYQSKPVVELVGSTLCLEADFDREPGAPNFQIDEEHLRGDQMMFWLPSAAPPGIENHHQRYR
jgi:hypothetical protein